MQKTPRSVGVHDGPFHADEVTACALLILSGLVDRALILRSRDPEVLDSAEFVCDVGGIYDPSQKLFDHHQCEYQGGLSSAGMILLYLLQEGYFSPEEYQLFQGSLVKGVDDHDNGKAPLIYGYCSFSHLIANYAPISHESSVAEMNKAFFAALDFTLGHISRLRERYLYNVDCRKIVREKMSVGREYLLFETSIPWLESFFALGGDKHSALFVIMPAGKHWKLRGIPPDYENRMKVRLPLPLAWAGLLGEDLKQVTHIPGAIFCHKGRFTSVWETREDAFLALTQALSQKEP